MSRIANQIISVCAWLVNFQPVLLPPPSGDLEVVDLFSPLSAVKNSTMMQTHNVVMTTFIAKHFCSVCNILNFTVTKIEITLILNHVHSYQQGE